MTEIQFNSIFPAFGFAQEISFDTRKHHQPTTASLRKTSPKATVAKARRVAPKAATVVPPPAPSPAAAAPVAPAPSPSAMPQTERGETWVAEMAVGYFNIFNLKYQHVGQPASTSMGI